MGQNKNSWRWCRWCLYPKNAFSFSLPFRSWCVRVVICVAIICSFSWVFCFVFILFHISIVFFCFCRWYKVFLFPADNVNFVVFRHYCQRFPLHVAASYHTKDKQRTIQKKRIFSMYYNGVALVIKCDVWLTQFTWTREWTWTYKMHIFYGWRDYRTTATIHNVLIMFR